MPPERSESNFLEESQQHPHDRVCEFIREAVHANLQVEVTGVDRPEIDKKRTETLAASLGVESPCRWRPYFS